MAELKMKLKASTLLEVIVAMVVILIVFMLATGIYTNVTGSSPSIKQQRVKALITGLLEKSINDGNWQDEQVVVDSLVLQKTVTPYHGYGDLVLMNIRVMERGKEIERIKQIVKLEQKGEDDAK